MDDWKKLYQAVDRLKIDVLREMLAPLYRTLRFRKTAAGLDEWADRIEARLIDGEADA